MKLTALAAVLADDPGPFATAYADVSRTANDSDDTVALTGRAAHDELVAAGCPEEIAELVDGALAAPTQGVAARVVVASSAGVRYSAVVHGRQPQLTTSWAPLPDLGSWLADAGLVVPFVLAQVDHEGGTVETYGDGAAEPVREVEEAGADPEYVHKASSGGLSAESHARSTEEEWKRSADAVAEEVERQVVAGPSLLVVAGDQDSVGQLRSKISHLEAEVVELRGGRRTKDGGDEAFDAELAETVRGQAVAANLAVIEQLEQRLGESAQGESTRGVTGLDAVLDALVQGQVDTLLVDPAAAAGTAVTVGDHPGLALGAVSPTEALPADQVLIAAAALTDADVYVERAGTIGSPAAALLRWDNTKEPVTDPEAGEGEASL